MKVFKEEQRFTQTWLFANLSIGFAVLIIVVAKEYANTTRSAQELAWTDAGIAISAVFAFFFQLKTRIDENGIYYQFLPFDLKMKHIQWQETEKAHVRNWNRAC